MQLTLTPAQVWRAEALLLLAGGMAIMAPLPEHAFALVEMAFEDSEDNQ